MQRPVVNQSENILTGHLEINSRGLQMLCIVEGGTDMELDVGQGNGMVCGLYLIFLMI